MFQFLTAVIFALAVSTTVAAEPRLALVVGNAAYTRISPLKNPTNDAALMRRNLLAAGYNVDFIANATRDQFRSAFSAFAAKREVAGKNASTILYFAGHGLQVDGVNYLLPIDADMSTPADVKRDAHNVGELGALLSTIEIREGGSTLLILDACSNNPFSSDLEIGRSRGLSGVDIKDIVDRSRNKFPPEYEFRSGLLIAIASEPGTTAMDGEGDNSPYVLALTKAIQQSPVDVMFLLKNTREEVNRLTNGAQKSWLYGTLGGRPTSLGFNKQQ